MNFNSIHYFRNLINHAPSQSPSFRDRFESLAPGEPAPLVRVAHSSTSTSFSALHQAAIPPSITLTLTLAPTFSITYAATSDRLCSETANEQRLRRQRRPIRGPDPRIQDPTDTGTATAAPWPPPHLPSEGIGVRLLEVSANLADQHGLPLSLDGLEDLRVELGVVLRAVQDPKKRKGRATEDLPRRPTLRVACEVGGRWAWVTGAGRAVPWWASPSSPPSASSSPE